LDIIDFEVREVVLDGRSCRNLTVGRVVLTNKLPNTAKVVVNNPVVLDATLHHRDDVAVTDYFANEPLFVIYCHFAL
jgi:hypothetical protein